MKMRIAVLGCALAIVSIPVFPSATGAVRSVGISGGNGFDTCTAPSLYAMQQWWPNTPWYDANIYSSGINRACAQPELTASWVSQVLAIGYDLIPTHVGLQAPCSGIGYVMSYDPATANQQGMNGARAAVRAAKSLGIYAPAIVYADIEAYDTSNAPCVAAVNAWVDGWVAQLHAKGFSAGVYGSSCGSNVAGWASLAHVPDDVWIANWNGVPSVWGQVCLDDSLWFYSQRLHQFLGGHNETWNGVTLNIDNDCQNGLLVGVEHENDGDGWCSYWGPGRSDLTDVAPFGEAVWAASRGQVFRSGDRGVTWEAAGPATSSGIAGSYFAGPTRAWVAAAPSGTGRVAVHRTSDGGASWEVSVLPDRYRDGYGSVHLSFIDERSGWLTLETPHGAAFARADVYATTDGGARWTKVASGPFAGPIRFVDGRRGFAVGDAGGASLYATEDAGRTWRRQPLPVGSDGSDLAISVGTPAFFGARGVVFARVRGAGWGRLEILTTEDAGRTWTPASSVGLAGSEETAAFAPLDANRWMLAIGGGLLRTDDAGRTWHRVESDRGFTGVTALRVADASHAYAILAGGRCAADRSDCSTWTSLLSTADGGRTWGAMEVGSAAS